MIPVTGTLFIDEKDIQWRFSRSGGKGGQNVNKVETRVELLFSLPACATLPGDVKDRLKKLAAKKLDGDGCLVVEASEHRTQERNREEALNKLIDLVRRASVRPKSRFKTKPSRSSKEKRLSGKKKDSEKKQGRGRPRGDD